MTSRLRAITVNQPFASLIVAGIKKWETRSCPPNGDMCPKNLRGMPGLKICRGERIAIHAAKTVPGRTHVGDWEWTWGTTQAGVISNGYPQHECYDAPLGAILGTVEVWDVTPIVDNSDRHIRWVYDTILGGCAIEPNFTYGAVIDDNGTLTNSGAPGLFHLNGDLFNCGAEGDITDQLPYGNWEPGYWAWMLVNPERFDQPIPTKGHQGVWWWEP